MPLFFINRQNFGVSNLFAFLNVPFQTDISNDRICVKWQVKSEVFPIVLLLVLGLIYIGISAAVVVLLYKQKGIFYLFTFCCTSAFRTEVNCYIETNFKIWKTKFVFENSELAVSVKICLDKFSSCTLFFQQQTLRVYTIIYFT